MTEQKKQALLQWLSKVIHIEVSEPSQLRSGQLLISLCNKIPGISIDYNPKYEGWKDSYLRLKTAHQQISSFMRNTIKYQFPNAIETINLVQMAKGHDDQSLMNFLQSIFLVSFNLGPQDSQIFIQKAMLVSHQHQYQLSEIVQNNPVPKSDNKQEEQQEQYEQKFEKQRQKVTSLFTTLQSLSSENDSLRETLITESQQIRKLNQQLKKVQQQRDKLKKQLLQSTYNKSQHQEDYNSTNKQAHSSMMNEHNQQMIEILKSNILEQEQNYSQQIYQLKEKIESLEEQLDIYKGKLADMEENSLKGIVDHTNCVNLQMYKKEKQQLTAKLTQASAKQWKVQLENTKLQNQLSQLKQKNKKLNDENKNMQNNPVCSKQQGNKLKLQFYTQLRDKLKNKLSQNISLANNEHTNNNKTIKRPSQNQQNIRNIIGVEDD